MTALKIMPMQWARVGDIDDVAPIGDDDKECLSEVYKVLARYGQQDRLGVALLHKHFELNDGEVMLEETDADRRELMIYPVDAENVGSGDVGTIWKLDGLDNKVTAYCKLYCRRWGLVGHDKGHASKVSA